MQQSNELAIWKEESTLAEIKKCFASKVNDVEWQTFLALGKCTGLNPFLKEMWIIKYKDSEPASIFISRDGYRKSAQCQADYDYHVCDAVYSNDKFKNDLDGETQKVFHSYEALNRGKLIGAYCFVKRKTSSIPHYQYVEAVEYQKYQSVWKEKPATMLKKVAEAQCLRMAFQNIYVGTYSEYEMWKREEIMARQISIGVIPPKQLPPSEPIDTSFTSIPDPSPKEPLSKEERLAIIKQVDEMKTTDTLKAVWDANSKKILSLSKVIKDPILEHFNNRKRDIAHEEAKQKIAS